MRPEGIAILDALPLSANGKSRRVRTTRPIARRPFPDAEVPRQRSRRGDGMRVWPPSGSDLLWESPDLGRDDDDFALGGHSLMALRTVLPDEP